MLHDIARMHQIDGSECFFRSHSETGKRTFCAIPMSKDLVRMMEETLRVELNKWFDNIETDIQL